MHNDRYIIPLTYLLNIIDYLFTLYWVSKFGIEIEGNPIGRWMFATHTAWLFKIVLNGVLLGIVGYYLRRHPEDGYLAWICLIAYACVVAYHIILAIITKQ